MLKSDYGLMETYTANQVISSIKRHKLSSNHLLYAIAIFSSAKQYESYVDAQDSVLGYKLARQEIADLFFKGDPSFSIPKITSAGLYVAGGSEHGSASSTSDGGGAGDG